MGKQQTALQRLRTKTGLTQPKFWGRVGVTQPAGSRYENGREMPKPVQMLLTIAYAPGRSRDRVIRKLWGVRQ